MRQSSCVTLPCTVLLVQPALNSAMVVVNKQKMEHITSYNNIFGFWFLLEKIQSFLLKITEIGRNVTCQQKEVKLFLNAESIVHCTIVKISVTHHDTYVTEELKWVRVQLRTALPLNSPRCWYSH